MMVCDGCGSKLVDGFVDMFCPNKSCDHDKKIAIEWLRKRKEFNERKELERLKAKYE